MKVLKKRQTTSSNEFAHASRTEVEQPALSSFFLSFRRLVHVMMLDDEHKRNGLFCEVRHHEHAHAAIACLLSTLFVLTGDV